MLRLTVEHLPKVLVPFRLGIFPEGLAGAHSVHVAQGVDVLRRDALHVVASPPAHANAGDVQRVARRAKPAAEHVARHDGEGDGRADVADEVPSRDALACHDGSLLNRPPLLAARAGRNKTANSTRITN